ncbi:MAG: S-formylglutathione hydrolase [Pseudomonadota bacterium]
MQTVSEARSFGGTQGVYEHEAASTGTVMRFSVYLPPAVNSGSVPVLYWLSGLTCTEENFTSKAGAQRVAAELGLAVVAPDTSPRGDGVPDDPEGAYDFGLGAGFYVDATEAPWSEHYQMRSYIEAELPALIEAQFPVDAGRRGIFGHSMGGHGALTIGLRNPSRYRSISAFAPIASPMHCPWGEKALGGYLGQERACWRPYDACALIEDGARVPELLVDQGTADSFLEEQLKPERLRDVCASVGIELTLRMQEGYDHSYYFIASFLEDHLRWHAERLID